MGRGQARPGLDAASLRYRAGRPARRRRLHPGATDPAPLPGPLRLRVHYAPRGPILLEATPEAARAALGALEGIARARHSLALTIDPTWREDGDLAATLPGSGFRPAAREVQVSRTAMVIPLRADEDEQHALLDDSTATNINKARRAGSVH